MKEAAKKRRNVIAMLDYINKQIHKYFKRLSVAGYEKDDDVMRLLCVIFISDMVGNDFNGFLEECDREIIEKAIYNLEQLNSPLHCGDRVMINYGNLR